MNEKNPGLRAHRYAAYFAPAADGPWWRAGSEWLGRSATIGGGPLAQPPVEGVTADEQQRLTRAPRRYGWHATLRAPFSLAESVSEAELRSRLRALCAGLQPFELPPLRVARLDDFLALRPEGGSAQADAVAAACVQGLQELTAPLSAADLARRRAAGLSPREDELLLRWGYPYVLERFRFHLSLTGTLEGSAPALADALEAAAVRHFAALPPCRFASVALFAEPHPGADMLRIEDMPLGNGQ